MTDYRAPNEATIPEFCRETGECERTAYRMVHRHELPHRRLGQKTIRVLMLPYRRMINGEPIAAELLRGEIVTTRASEDAA